MPITLNRIVPAAPASAFKTYSFTQRPDLLVRTACEQAGCEKWLLGWKTPIDESTDTGRDLARYIRFESGRTFTEQRSGALTIFVFDSRQRCFADHKTMPQKFLVRAGDWRNMVWVQVSPGVWDWRHDPRNVQQVHQDPADWVEDFGLHQQRVAADQARG